MRPTDEQSAAIEAGVDLRPGEAAKIIAFAGSGKSTTLLGVARGRRDKGLYNAFNRSIADEFHRKMSGTNCQSKTMHATAYSVLRHIIGKPIKLNARTIIDDGFMNRFNMPRLSKWGEYRTAAAVCRTIAAFCNSDDANLSEKHARSALIATEGDPSFLMSREKIMEVQEVFDKVVPVVTTIAAAYYDRLVAENRMSHDMYLKALDLNEAYRHQAYSGYGYLMLDEAQDANAVQRSILEKTGLPLIAVGDPWQQIYSWRGAENALSVLPGKELYLTQSFRFGEEIAETARKILALRPEGAPEKRLTGFGGQVRKLPDGASVGIICRTNMGVFETGIRLMRAGRSICVDNMDGLVEDVLSAVALHEGRLSDVKSPLLKPFNSWQEMEIEAEAGNIEIGKMVTIVESGMAEHMPNLDAHRVSREEADIEICTAHRSKGREWLNVRLGGDFKDTFDLQERWIGARGRSEAHKVQALEEFNTLYVAATRPMQRLSGHERLIRDPMPEDFGIDVQREIRNMSREIYLDHAP